MRISEDFRDHILDHLEDDRPNECCGWMLMENGVVTEAHRAENIKPSEVTYEMDAASLLTVNIADDAGAEIAIYHSHPFGPPFPSTVDVANAFYPHWLYVIVGRDGDIKAWNIQNGTVIEDRVVIG